MTRKAKAEIASGVCGYHTTVEAKMNGAVCELRIQSGCTAVGSLAAHLKDVDPFQEISFRGEIPRTLQLAAEHCSHAACPVPTGIIKAVEVAAGLALPKDVYIQLTKLD
jgi:hypothetical protein